jgi:hypothetical protein
VIDEPTLDKDINYEIVRLNKQVQRLMYHIQLSKLSVIDDPHKLHIRDRISEACGLIDDCWNDIMYEENA